MDRGKGRMKNGPEICQEGGAMERRNSFSNPDRKPEGLSGERRAAWWRERILAREASGLNRRAFCRASGVSLTGLTYWERKFREEGLGPEPSETPDPPRFLPVRIRCASGEAAGGGGLNAWVGEVRLEVRPGFDADLLREAVLALRGL